MLPKLIYYSKSKPCSNDTLCLFTPSYNLFDFSDLKFDCLSFKKICAKYHIFGYDLLHQ
jgi:hypothetical protein